MRPTKLGVIFLGVAVFASSAMLAQQSAAPAVGAQFGFD